MNRSAAVILSVLLPLAFSAQAPAQPPVVLTLANSIPLAGVSGSFDHFAFDRKSGRFFLAAEDHGTVEVFALDSGKHLATIGGFKNPHSILILPGAPNILVTDSGASRSQLIDTSTLKRVRYLRLALGANCLIYDAQKKRAYVTAGGDRVGMHTSTLIAVDPKSGGVLQFVKVDALHLQPMALDTAKNRLFVNLADQNAVGIFDRGSLRLLAKWKIESAKRNSPIAFDAEHHRLFVVCDDPGVLVVFNTDTGKITDSVPVPADADDMDFDPASRRLFIPGERSLVVFDASNPDHVKKIAQVQTGTGAHTGLLLAREHKYLLAVPRQVKGEPAHVLIFNIR